MHRRTFLGTIASVGAAVAAHGIRADSPNEKLNLACIGVANKGGHNIDQLKGQNIVALCDVDSEFLGKAAEKFPKAAKYRDYREMLDKQAKGIDAVVVSTADHMHAPAASAALSLGKHVYCEKPMAHTVAEARKLAALAAKHNVATQMGTQIHAGENYRRVVELIRAGSIGPVREVHAWCNKEWSGAKFEQAKAPDHLDWDLWLGPAPGRPYCKDIHPKNWRRFWEFGSGTFGDMACHVLDLPFWALDLTAPTAVRASGSPVDPVSAAAWVIAEFDFPATKARPAVKVHWMDGGKHTELVRATKDAKEKPLSSWGLGALFVGDKGMLAADYSRHVLLPQDKFSDFAPPSPSIPKSEGHWNEWVKACKTGSATTCNFAYSGALTETVLLGVVAFRSGDALEWDAAQLRVRNSAKAQELISKEYRKGFELIG